MTAVIYNGSRSGTGFFHRTAPYWLDKSQVAEQVQAAVRLAEWESPEADGRTGRTRTLCTEIMLAVLTYCYALGIYRAAEIESAIASGLMNAGVVDGAPLDRSALIRFRRQNRNLLTDCLAKVLQSLPAPPSARGATVVADEEEAASQARMRIDRAAEWDCLECDE